MCRLMPASLASPCMWSHVRIPIKAVDRQPYQLLWFGRVLVLICMCSSCVVSLWFSSLFLELIDCVLCHVSCPSCLVVRGISSWREWPLTVTLHLPSQGIPSSRGRLWRRMDALVTEYRRNITYESWEGSAHLPPHLTLPILLLS